MPVAKTNYDGYIGLEFRPSKSGEEAVKGTIEIARKAEALATG